jgi:hypothetical protein
VARLRSSGATLRWMGREQRQTGPSTFPRTTSLAASVAEPSPRFRNTNQAIAATTVTAAMPVVNAMARAKTTAIFFMIVSLFADALPVTHRLAWLSFGPLLFVRLLGLLHWYGESGPQPAEGAPHCAGANLLVETEILVNTRRGVRKSVNASAAPNGACSPNRHQLAEGLAVVRRHL